MAWQRIKTVLLYSWYHLNHSLETWIDLFWFPIIELIVFGAMGAFFDSGDLGANGVSLSQTIILGLIYWEVIRLGQYSITVGVLWDVWSRSFSSLFISPLKMSEHLVGQMISGAIKTFVVSSVMVGLSYFFLGVNWFNLGIVGVIAWLILIVFSWAAGLFVTGLIFKFGTDIQSFAWGLIYLVQPISAVVYPLEALPEQIRPIAYLSPVTYVMEAVRTYWATQVIDWQFLGIGTAVTIIYFILGSWYFHAVYVQAKKTGAFARMDT